MKNDFSLLPLAKLKTYFKDSDFLNNAHCARITLELVAQLKN